LQLTLRPQGLLRLSVEASVKLQERMGAGELHRLRPVERAAHRNLSTVRPLLDQAIKIG
jgi:hypothetical protein